MVNIRPVVQVEAVEEWVVGLAGMGLRHRRVMLVPALYFLDMDLHYFALVLSTNRLCLEKVQTKDNHNNNNREREIVNKVN